MHGSKGLLSAGNVHETTVLFAGAKGVVADPVQNFFLERYAAAYRHEIEAFIDAVEGGTKPSPDGVDGLKTGHPGDEGYLLIATAPVGGENATVLVWNTPAAAQRGTDALRLLASLRAMAKD